MSQRLAVDNERLFASAIHELMLLPDGLGGWREIEAVEAWRLRDRFKTVAAALVLCLNVGVDPPDVIKPDPCARSECWLDPASMPAQKALEAIGKALQAQYECTRSRAARAPAPIGMRMLCPLLGTASVERSRWAARLHLCARHVPISIQRPVHRRHRVANVGDVAVWPQRQRRRLLRLGDVPVPVQR